MTKRSRVVAFGGASLLVVAGIAGAITVGGLVGQILAIVLVGTGLVAAVGLAFYEVGLSEDQERAREERARMAGPAPATSRRLSPMPRLGRMRGARRRLR